eukprot:gene56872-biopygen604
MLHGLAFLHSKGVVHGDFKTGNVLIFCTQPRCPDVRIADFDCA